MKVSRTKKKYILKYSKINVGPFYGGSLEQVFEIVIECLYLIRYNSITNYLATLRYFFSRIFGQISIRELLIF